MTYLAPDAGDLTQLGNFPGYAHYPKQATPGIGLRLPGTYLKWYDVAKAETPVPDTISTLARRYIERNAGRLGLDGDLGFAMVHRCGSDFYFLLVSTWRGNNELWESVYAKDGADLDFYPWPDPGHHRGGFCVWEFEVVRHERNAWVRYLNSPRAEADKRAWLAEIYEGEV
jgi:hypothetical protein